MFDFQDKAVIVTGAASGIGKATAEYSLRMRGEGAARRHRRGPGRNRQRRRWTHRQRGPGASSATTRRRPWNCSVRVVDACVAQWARLDSAVASAGARSDRPRRRRATSVWRRTPQHQPRRGGCSPSRAQRAPRSLHRRRGGRGGYPPRHRAGPSGTRHGRLRAEVLVLTRGAARGSSGRGTGDAVSPGSIDTPMMRRDPRRRSVRLDSDTVARAGGERDRLPAKRGESS